MMTERGIIGQNQNAPQGQKEEKMVWARVIGVMVVGGFAWTLVGCQQPPKSASNLPMEQTEPLSSSTASTAPSESAATTPSASPSPIELVQAPAAASAPVEVAAVTAPAASTSSAPSPATQGAASVERTKKVQAALQAAGFYTGSVDGKSGPMTQKAIHDFQQANGLETDGKVGPKTWAKLFQQTASSGAASKPDSSKTQ